jgi:tRNA pseudouridine38-40 synthase
MRNLKLVIEFDGSQYAGWQYQPRHRTVQGEVEAAIGRIIQEKVTVYGCARTDAGVSARAYAANVHIDSRLGPERLKLAINHFLPEDILIRSVEEAEPGFHARHSALGKTYVYHIVQRKSPLRRRFAWEVWFKLDTVRMGRAAPLFEGVRDFRAFCQTRDENGVCRVRHVRVVASGDEVLVTVAGDRFLYKMVRRIVGALVACGAGRLTQKDIRSALVGKPYPPFQTAPSRGLLLESVRYRASRVQFPPAS